MHADEPEETLQTVAVEESSLVAPEVTEAAPQQDTMDYQEEAAPVAREGSRERERSRSVRASPPPPRRDTGFTERQSGGHQPPTPTPSNVLGVFGLSIRTRETDLEEEFGRHGRVEKVVIVYDQRSERSRGFGFVTMRDVADAQSCITALSGMDLHGRRLRVDFSATVRPHNPTPGEYRGAKRDDDYPARGGGGAPAYGDRWAAPPRRDDRYGGGRDDRYGGGRDDRYGGGRDDRYGGGYQRSEYRGPGRESYGGRDGGRERERSRSPPRRRRSHSRSVSPRRRDSPGADRGSERSVPPPREGW